MLLQAPGQRCDTSLVGTGDMPTFLGLMGFIRNHPYCLEARNTAHVPHNGAHWEGRSKSQQCRGWSQGSDSVLALPQSLCGHSYSLVRGLLEASALKKDN